MSCMRFNGLEILEPQKTGIFKGLYIMLAGSGRIRKCRRAGTEIWNEYKYKEVEQYIQIGYEAPLFIRKLG